ncbi:IclR family transcriptional regulator, partial [Micromonospora sp. DH15]|nr:IclR family transcriptional regulator [Micromonospora sp. DH15]
GVACAAVLVVPDKDMERRMVLAFSLPASEMMTSARVVRAKLLTAARAIADAVAAEN